MASSKRRAPTLYAIIVIKLGKGLLLLAAAAGIYSLLDHNITADFQSLLKWIHLDPERRFWMELAHKFDGVTPANLFAVAGGTAFYSLFSLVEGVGLIFRVSWAGWMAIGESMFFIPIEVYDLMHGLSVTVAVILVLNIGIVWYLLRNRHRLFHRHVRFHHAPAPAPAATSDADPEI